MALYAIGDVQGCDEELAQLLRKIRFNADRDQLWFVGDLVNRGPDSLAVLRRVRALGGNAVATLGNHDLHLLAIAFGKAKVRRNDTLDELLAASDFEALLQWLIQCPFMHLGANSIALLHAGLPPQWDIETARACAREAEAALTHDPERFLAKMYGDQPSSWDPKLSGADRTRFITNCFTRMRYIRADGSLDLREKDAPGVVTPGVVTPGEAAGRLMPWFECETALWRGTHIVFGHWSTLGYFRNRDVTSLDTGCGWGNRLTALQMDRPDAGPVAIDCARYARP